MAINKIIVDGVTKIDLTQDTVMPDKVLEGYTFHDATGSLLTGTMKAGADVGDLTLYTKFAYNYDDYSSNGYSTPEVSAYDENYYSITCWFVKTNSDGISEINSSPLDPYNSGDTVYVVSTKKIDSVDVSFGGGCGS